MGRAPCESRNRLFKEMTVYNAEVPPKRICKASVDILSLCFFLWALIYIYTYVQRGLCQGEALSIKLFTPSASETVGICGIIQRSNQDKSLESRFDWTCFSEKHLIPLLLGVNSIEYLLFASENILDILHLAVAQKVA